MKVSVVIPTYNEAENIGKLIPGLKRVLGEDVEIIIVDDSSPDGTAEIARKLGSRVVSRPGKLGLSSAIMEGIRAAGNETVIVMDADLQHPPELIPELVENSEGCDIVIASRYVKGGRIEGWGLFRKIVSKTATLMARVLLPGAREVKDPLSGFFLVKRSRVLDAARRMELRGFKFLLDLLSAGRFRVREIPYTFRARKHGKSKFSLVETANYLLLLLKLSEYRVFKSAAVGTAGIAVNEGVLYLLVRSGFPLGTASPIAIESSILSNFALNDLWTFRKRRGGSFISRLLKYHGAVALGAAINFLTLMVLVQAGVHFLLANLAGIFLGFAANYIGSEIVVWSISRSGRKPGLREARRALRSARGCASRRSF